MTEGESAASTSDFNADATVPPLRHPNRHLDRKVDEK